jgi:chromate transport protein ChrA
VGDVPAVIIGVIGYFVARASGRSRVPSVFYGLTALALGIVVALVKSMLAAH